MAVSGAAFRPPLTVSMRKKILALFQRHYRRYHDILFYVLTLGVIIISTYAAIEVSRVKNEQERENLQEREIPAVEYTVKEKPVYVALQESGLDNQSVAQIVNKLGSVVDTRKLQKRDTYSVSVDSEGNFILLLLTQGFKRYYVANVDGALVAGVSDVEIKTRIKTAAGKVEGALFNSMLSTGISGSFSVSSQAVDNMAPVASAIKYRLLRKKLYDDICIFNFGYVFRMQVSVL